jgi:hypothetical protein
MDAAIVMRDFAAAPKRVMGGMLLTGCMRDMFGSSSSSSSQV